MNHPTTAYVALGSNLGDREAAIRSAVDALDRSAGLAVTAMSALRETSPIGAPGQGRYLNAVVRIRAFLTPHRLLERCLIIEAAHGRDRRDEPRWGPRPLDLDVLLYGEEIIDGPDLTVPHPRMHERLFVLEPMAEIAPALIHPVLGRTMESLCQTLLAGSAAECGSDMWCSCEQPPPRGRTAQRLDAR